MSKRRQKIALRIRTKVLHNCRPVAVGDLQDTDDPNIVTLDITFDYEVPTLGAHYGLQGLTQGKG